MKAERASFGAHVNKAGFVTVRARQGRYTEARGTSLAHGVPGWPAVSSRNAPRKIVRMAQLDPRQLDRTYESGMHVVQSSRCDARGPRSRRSVGLAGTLVVACSDGSNPAQLGGGNQNPEAGSTDPCAVPNQGCSCKAEEPGD